MTAPLNDFATKVYSEHPTIVWPLDDDVSYISLVSSESSRLFSTWLKSTGSAYDNNPTYLPPDPLPFQGESFSSWTVTAPSDGYWIEADSPALFQTINLNQTMKSFNINLYIYQDSTATIEYELGYKKGSTYNLLNVVAAPTSNSWIHLTANDIPVAYDSEDIKVVIRIKVNTGSHIFTINGFSVGQWSETTSSKSFGVIPITIPLPFTTYTGVPAEQYGILSENAYYISESNKLLAVNDGVPMVFGSSNVTKLYPSPSGQPSFIFPGKGMLHESGRYLDWTLEFWLKIKPNTTSYRRIVGQFENDYGIYISENSISLVIGNSVKSHPIYEWYRPMLMHLESKGSSVSLMINGEQIIEIEVDKSSLTLPSLAQKDWWGFYSYSDIDIFEIDCLSIYPYAVPDLVAKKRFVWGQGVDTEKNIDTYFSGETASVAFPYANYTANKIYPDIERWDAGYVENLVATPDHITFPDYQLPNINIGGKDLQEWYDDNSKINNIEYPYSTHPKFITFRPNIDTSERVNLCTNPSFETNATGWASAQSSTVQSSAFALIGTKSLETTMSAADTNIAYTVQIFPEIGRYFVSAYVYIPTGSTIAGRTVLIQAEGGTATYTNSTSSVATLSIGNWVRVSRIIDITAVGTANVVFRISPSTVSGQKVYIDAVLVEKSLSLESYFDGSTDPRARWGIDENNPSTAHASISVLKSGYRTNLVLNPSFENDTSNWSVSGGSGNLVRSTVDPVFGSYCGLQTTDGSAYCGLFPYGVPISPSTYYTGSMYIKNIDVSLQFVPIIAFFDSNYAYISQISGNYSVASDYDWQRLSVTAESPSNAAFAFMEVIINGTESAGKKFYVDCAMIEPSNEIQKYFDGSFENGEWTGTENASSSIIPQWEPNDKKWNSPSYLNFESINIFNNQIAAIYGIFEPSSIPTEDNLLMSFVNNTSGKIFEVKIVNGDELHYILDGTDLESIGVPIEILDGEHFVAGFNIPTLSKLSYEISEFFSNPQLIQLYVGGNGIDTFDGKIYRIGFSYQDNFQDISTHFDDITGIAKSDDSALMTSHYASYTLVPTYRYNRFFLDIAASGQWEEYFPLSYFAKNVTDAYGNINYKLGPIQVNIDAPISYSEVENELYGYKEVSLSSSQLVPNLTFQLISEGADEPISSFLLEKLLPITKVIDADSVATEINPYAAYKTKFNFIDNTVVYAPTAIDFNKVAIVINLSISHDGLLSNPFMIRKLELSSFVSEDTSFSAIGTKFGNEIVPYVQSGIYYDKNIKNPVSTYKGNTPYLYLTENSGVNIRYSSNTELEYGALIPINKEKSPNSSIGIFDVWMKYDSDIPAVETMSFEIDHANGSVQFTIIDDGTGRGKISAIDYEYGTDYSNIVFYQNGIVVENPTILKNEWNNISILFPNSLNFDNYCGSFKLVSGATFKSASYYKSAGLGESFSVIYRPWEYVLDPDPFNPPPPDNYKWSDWSSGTWQDVYVISSNLSFVTTSKDIYETYIGTNRNVVDDVDGIVVYNDDVNIYSGISWSSSDYIPS